MFGWDKYTVHEPHLNRVITIDKQYNRFDFNLERTKKTNKKIGAKFVMDRFLNHYGKFSKLKI